MERGRRYEKAEKKKEKRRIKGKQQKQENDKK